MQCPACGYFKQPCKMKHCLAVDDAKDAEIEAYFDSLPPRKTKKVYIKGGKK